MKKKDYGRLLFGGSNEGAEVEEGEEQRVFLTSDIFAFSQIFAEDAPDELGPGESYTVEWPVFRQGKFKHPWYGELDFTSEYLYSLVNNHKLSVSAQLPSIDVGHDADGQFNGIGAIGWVEDRQSGLFVRKQEIETTDGRKELDLLFARVELNRLGYSLIRDKRYRYFSSEIHPNYTTREVFDKETEKGEAETIYQYGATFIGGGVTNRPFIPHLGQVSLSENGIKKNQKSEKGVLFKSVEDSCFGVFIADKEDKQEQTRKVFSVPQNITNTIEETEEKEEETVETETQFNQENQGEKRMKFSDVLAKLKELKNPSEKVDYMEDVQHEFSGDNADAQLFSDYLDAMREAREARKEADAAIQQKQQYKARADKLEEEKIAMSNDLRDAREGTRMAQVQAFCDEIRGQGHTEAVVKEVNDILTGLDGEVYSQSFSLVNGEDESEVRVLDIMKRVFSKIPAGPVNGEEIADANDDVTVPRDGEDEVAPEGTQKHSQSQSDDDELPANVQAFVDKNNYLPQEYMWEDIDANGVYLINSGAGKE